MLRSQAGLLAADTADGSAETLNWVVDEKKIAPHIPVKDMSRREGRSASACPPRAVVSESAMIICYSIRPAGRQPHPRHRGRPDKVERSKEKWREVEVNRIAGEIARRSPVPDMGKQKSISAQTNCSNNQCPFQCQQCQGC